jgi:O-acetyl-ADP-ribose deacetylase (regulator of RNase III)
MGKLSEKFLEIYQAHRQKVSAVEQETVASIMALLDEVQAAGGTAAAPAGSSLPPESAAARGVTVTPRSDRKIEVIRADITTLELDAIVNPASRSLQGGGGIEGAIFAAGGPNLVAECRALGGLERGEAKISHGHDLPAKYVIHTVGPVWKGGDQGEAELLAGCYRNCLDLALANQIRSIAFPAISTGNFGYPVEEAARIAAAETVKFAQTHARIDKIYLVCWDDLAFDAFSAALDAVI